MHDTTEACIFVKMQWFLKNGKFEVISSSTTFCKIRMFSLYLIKHPFIWKREQLYKRKTYFYVHRICHYVYCSEKHLVAFFKNSRLVIYFGVGGWKDTVTIPCYSATIIREVSFRNLVSFLFQQRRSYYLVTVLLRTWILVNVRLVTVMLTLLYIAKSMLHWLYKMSVFLLLFFRLFHFVKFNINSANLIDMQRLIDTMCVQWDPMC